jgi:hypothetical protein
MSLGVIATVTVTVTVTRGYLSNNSIGDQAQVDVYIGTAANETIINKTDGHNFIITGDGNDVRNSLLLGGAPRQRRAAEISAWPERPFRFVQGIAA